MSTQQDREFVEKVRSIGFVQKYKPGAKQKKEVTNQDDGKPAGYHVEHHDGSQDAVAQPRTLELELRMKNQGEE